tara:strand:+ start:312 stop:716 length:405 start_codon:yes stop_codon:yes gene_type:complete
MKKSSSSLSLSSSDSYQSLSELTVECCICLDEVKNEDSFMPDCLHSWCKNCNEELNKKKIETCPLCKNGFKSVLRNGRWKFISNPVGGYWLWEKGFEDSKKKIKIKKVQSIFYNIGSSFSNLQSGPISLGGISI